MKSKIKLYRVVLNIIFYVFYVLLASIAFSFVFPTILVIFWQEVWLSNDPRFTSIQIWIVVLVLVFSLIFRKYCFLPIMADNNEPKEQKKRVVETNTKEIKQNIKKTEKVKKERKLDIKIGKEIKK